MPRFLLKIMQMPKRFLGALLAFCVLASPAQAAESNWITTDFAKIRLISASETVGSLPVLSLGLEVILKEGWKTYWRTAGDAGLPPQLFPDPFLLMGAEVAIDYPLPKRFSLFGLDTFGYADHVIFPVTIKLEDLSQASRLSLMAEMLICSDICVPVSGDLSLSLPQGSNIPSIYAQDLAKAMAKVPRIADKGVTLSQAPDNQSHLFVTITEPVGQMHDILIEGADAAAYRAPIQESDLLYRLVPANADKAVQAGASLTATIDAEQGFFETSVMVQADAGLTSNDAVPDAAPLLATLSVWLAALLGGFILNFMPCVLPVISIKVSSVLAMGGTSKEIIRNRFLMSAAGIMSSFVLLALFLQMLRLAGGQIGWGIQFQSPVFLGMLLFVSVLFALSLFDVIVIRAPSFVSQLLPARHSTSYAGDFGAGMLATLLATPCSAPFVGTAISFALTQNDLLLYGIFLMMGLGLSLPWLFMALFPATIALLPKPGAWMMRLKQAMGLLMVLTVIWLASLWAGAIGLTTSAGKGGNADTGWQSYDAAQLVEARATSQLILVDVTADWCITCKANKALVLDTAPVKQMLAEKNVLLIQADWTLADDEIARFLASYDKFGIPFNIIYGTGAKDGLILPEIFTATQLERALEKANQ